MKAVSGIHPYAYCYIAISRCLLSVAVAKDDVGWIVLSLKCVESTKKLKISIARMVMR
jgi:hypothetical protein